MALTETQLTHVHRLIVGTPLMVRREKLDAILAAVGPRIGLHVEQPGAEAAAGDSPRSRVPLRVDEDGIARIQITGTLTRRNLLVEAFSGLSGYDKIGAEIDAALEDPRVKGILLEVDSPGGEAGGVFDLADRIRTARESKPIVAHAGEDACSAAYALACAAHEVYTTRTGCVGSIGVFALHVDQSGSDEQRGLAYTYVHAGDKKVLGNSHEPLSDAARKQLQAEVSRIYDLFVASVAESRPQLSEQQIRAQEGGVFFGPNAEAFGLVDGIATQEGALQALHERIRAMDLKKELEAAKSKIATQQETITQLRAALEERTQAEAARAAKERTSLVNESVKRVAAAGGTPPTQAEREKVLQLMETDAEAGAMLLDAIEQRCLATAAREAQTETVTLDQGSSDDREVLEHQAKVMRQQGYSCEIKGGTLVVHGKKEG